VAATSGRARNRHSAPRYSARAGAPGPAAEHRSKIMAVLVAGVAGIVLVLSMTSDGHHIDAATQRFMLYYAGVFALIGLTASVGVGLVATDRVILTPGHRVMAQAVHRAASFGALAFLIVHIVTEILAQRVHVIDAFVPFLSPFRTFYIGLGTIASDLILLLVITGIIRKRFTSHGKAWRWRAIHYTAYVSFVFGVLHGLMAGRSAKPYVDWSYGFAIAMVAMGLVVRYLAISMRPKENLSAPPGQGGGGMSALRGATIGLAQAQLGGTVQVLPAGAGAGAAARVQIGSSYGGITPLSAPSYGDDMGYGSRAVASLPGSAEPSRQPLYEPGYVGPPRYEGAPRAGTGPMPGVSTGPMPRLADSGPVPRVADSGPMPRIMNSGPMPRLGDSGPMPRVNTGPMPRLNTGPIPRVNTGPIPRLDTGPMPRVNTRPVPRSDTGPIPRVNTGPIPRVNTGPVPRSDTGPAPRAATGPLPRAGSGPMPQAGNGGPPRQAPGGRGHRAGQHRPARYPSDSYPSDRDPSDRGSSERGSSERGSAEQYPSGWYAAGEYPSEQYPPDQQSAGPYPSGPSSAPSRGSARRPRRPAPGPARHRDQGPSDPRTRDSSRREGDQWR
jgi:DMSO/TMAO reductase YedYZ heme-binding membrane subunit